MTTADLFDGFDAATVDSITRGLQAQQQATGQARAVRTKSRIQTRRATAEKHLASILPARFERGDSWHVMSHGDIDSLSYLRHALAGVSHFDHVLMSTWCIAKADLYAGEIFPSQYGDEYEQMLTMCEVYGCRLVVARNHSKVTLCENRAEGYRLSIESSANVNTNPRIEQTAIHCSDELHAFHREFFHGLRSIDRSSRQAR